MAMEGKVDSKMDAIMSRMDPKKMAAHMKGMMSSLRKGKTPDNVKPSEVKDARKAALATVFAK